ncbi:neuronal acetylcholine receptor subunit beta-3-like [Venturia canescens]|uniref:neuronal acetylcholine receptor subunit beta-3-like n=1 Tax=Venturia canescens TaxID=32260 RepID=UPI001C9C106A|nr:neuronal acetylcholine receptor subunit beta-3-like [Venturia canescens]
MMLLLTLQRQKSWRTTCSISVLFAFVFFNLIASDDNLVNGFTYVRRQWNDTWTDQLKKVLLFRYDKFARPAQHFNKTVVDFDIRILEVAVDDSKSSMDVQCWIKMAWTDDKLKWNPTDYGGLDQLHVGNHEVWQPDIILYNSAAAASIEYYGDTHCLIYSNGTVIWVPPAQFHALCHLDLRFWPFDTQECYLKLGSWTYHGEEIDLRLSKTPMHLSATKKYSQWEILSMTADRSLKSYGPHKYVSLVYAFTLKRLAPIYYSTLVAPAATIVFLILVIFWLPPQNSEKMNLCGLTTLIISIFLIYFGHKLPPLHGKPPLLICFYSGCLHVVTFSLIISALVINLSRHPHCRPLPRLLKKILVGKLGQYLALCDEIRLIESRRSEGEQELRENESMGGNSYRQSSPGSFNCSENGERENIIVPATSTNQLEWILAATVVDRLAFFLFSTIFAIMAMVCLT